MTSWPLYWRSKQRNSGHIGAPELNFSVYVHALFCSIKFVDDGHMSENARLNLEVLVFEESGVNKKTPKCILLRGVLNFNAF